MRHGVHRRGHADLAEVSSTHEPDFPLSAVELVEVFSAGAKVMEGDFADGYDSYRSWVGVTGEQRTRIFLYVVAGMLFIVLFITIVVIIDSH